MITNIGTLKLHHIQLRDKWTENLGPRTPYALIYTVQKIPEKVNKLTDIPFPFNRGACSSISETEALMCGGSGEDGYGRDCWKFDGEKYTQTNGTKYARDWTPLLKLFPLDKLTKLSIKIPCQITILAVWLVILVLSVNMERSWLLERMMIVEQLSFMII